MILSIHNYILSLTLLCPILVMAKNYTLSGVKLKTLCVENQLTSVTIK